MSMSIAVFEGYRGPKSRRRKRMAGKRSMRKRMKACARKHKVTSRGFWTCVRRGGGRRRR